MKHKWPLAILALLIAACGLLLQSAFTDVKERAIVELNTQQTILAQQAARKIQGFFDRYTHMLNQLSENPGLVRMDAMGKELIRVFYETHAHEIRSITRLDPTGRVIFASPHNPAIEGADLSAQEHVRRMIETHRLVLSDVFKSAQGYDGIALHVPLFADGVFEGSLGILFSFDQLAKDALEGIRIGQDGYAWIISRKGIELFCPVPGHVGHSVFENCKDYPSILSMAHEMLQGKSGTATYVFDKVRGQAVESVKKHAVYLPVRLPDTFWSIVVATPETEVLANISGFRDRWILIIGILVIAVGYSSFVLARALFIVRGDEKRREVEAALKVNERRLARAELVARFGNWEFDLSRNQVRASKGARIIYGLGDEEMTIRQVQTIPLPEYREMLDTALRDLIEENKPYNVEFKVRRPSDGQIIDIHSIAEYSPDDRVVFGVIQDITLHKQAETALAEEANRRRILFEQSRDGIVILNEKGGVYEANQGYADMLGYTMEELSALHVWDWDAQWPREELERQIQLVGTEGDHFETRHRRKDGTIFDVEITSHASVWAQQKLIYCVCRDITERKRAEEERERLQAQLIHAQKMESVGRLAGGVAHDFNNMLGVIIGHTEMALTMVENDGALSQGLEEVLKAAHRSAELTRQLLAFARKQTVNPHVLDLNETISGMLKMLSRLIGENIELVWNPGPDLGRVLVDPSQVDQLLANLTVNARDAIAGVGKITIETTNLVLDEADCEGRSEIAPGSYVQLTVSDTGGGMPGEVVDHIFEPFFTTKDVGKGTGLGLAMVYGIVKQNNGFVSVYSEPGKGTAFKIILPRHDGDLSTVEQDTSTRARLQGKETLLIVEDEEAILKIGIRILHQLGYTVLSANSPEDALELAREYPGDIHLLITDVVMPNMNGSDLASRLLELRPGLKTLFMSGYTADIIAHHGVLDRGVYFIEKPFRMKAMAEMVRKALSGD